ncbi:MAG: EscU/YscU/HrcU family type III secretion system export apparatus switch protein [Acetobacteraceae bacterium]|nr:EscU/YscU/HrcU family type III secretion system export apparatus switch protein [Acetobacteraceae bacterium]
MADSEDRTLAATDRRRAQAREDGQAPLSRELVSVSGLAALTLSVAMLVPRQLQTLEHRLAAMLASPAASPGAALREAAIAILQFLLPVAGAAAFAGCAAVLLQTGWLIHVQSLMPDLSRLNPRRGLKRVFGISNTVEAAKSLGKVAVIGWAVWHVLSGALAATAGTISLDTSGMLDRLARDTMQVLVTVLACQAAIALFDMGWTRFRFGRQLRMSLEEIKHEQKEMDGDPRLKAKIKQIRTVRARRRMLAAVAKATVVVTNPTHYAVALAYDRGSRSAPKIVAKGVDEMAARIRETATKHGVPLVPNPPLARALHLLPLDAEVPAEHFKAVAEIIAFVWRLRTPGRNAP